MTPAAQLRWQGRGIVRGIADGPALVSTTSISFLGDVEITTGRVIGRSSDLVGACVAGAVLVVPSTRGSAGAWRFLYQLRKHETHPVAIVMHEMPDPSVVQGAILSAIPIVVDLPRTAWRDIRTGQGLWVDGTDGTVTMAAPAVQEHDAVHREKRPRPT